MIKNFCQNIIKLIWMTFLLGVVVHSNFNGVMWNIGDMVSEEDVFFLSQRGWNWSCIFLFTLATRYNVQELFFSLSQAGTPHVSITSSSFLFLWLSKQVLLPDAQAIGFFYRPHSSCATQFRASLANV